MVSSNSKDFDKLGPVPDNFVIVPFAPQLTILRERADLFICHGGLNSVLESIREHVKIIVLPTIIERCVNSYCLKDLGLGDYIPPPYTPQALRDLCIKTINDKQLDENIKNFAPIIYAQQPWKTVWGIESYI